MARTKGIKQARNESKYWLPEGVSLKEDQFDYNKETKLIFIDSQYGEFESSFHNIQRAGFSCHPKAIYERQIQRVKNLTKDKYVEKRQNTMLKKYGVKNALENPEILQKAQETLFNKYGVKTPMESDELRKRQMENTFKKYGVENPGKLTQLRILPNGKNVKEYCREKDVPNPMAYRIFEWYGAQSCQDWIDTYTDKISCLEKVFQKLFPEAEYFRNVPEGLKHYRPDFKIGNLFVDVDGLECHSELRKEDRNYHKKKLESYNNAGYKLIQIRQDELLLKPEVVKSLINSKIGKVEQKYFARKLIIKEIKQPESIKFFEINHLMGSSRGVKTIGLFNNEELICALSYKRIKNGIDISRFATKLNCLVVGGLSKLISYLEKKECPNFIQSFVDMRYGDGHSLKMIGFELKTNMVSFRWTNGYKTFHRLECRANMDERNLTQEEYAKEKKWFRIWDAGQSLFIKHII